MATAQSKMSVREKLETAVEFKDKGNASYKDGEYKAAARSYHKAILYLKVMTIDVKRPLVIPDCRALIPIYTGLQPSSKPPRLIRVMRSILRRSWRRSASRPTSRVGLMSISSQVKIFLFQSTITSVSVSCSSPALTRRGSSSWRRSSSSWTVTTRRPGTATGRPASG